MDIRDIERLGRRYDIILSMDVLEHLEKNDALAVMKKLEMMCDMMLIISLPIGRQSHGDGDENIHQLHKSIFHQDEMEKYGYKIRSMSKFTRILRFVEKIRCFLFRLEYKEGRFVAWKEFDKM